MKTNLKTFPKRWSLTRTFKRRALAWKEAFEKELKEINTSTPPNSDFQKGVKWFIEEILGQ